MARAEVVGVEEREGARQGYTGRQGPDQARASLAKSESGRALAGAVETQSLRAVVKSSVGGEGEVCHQQGPLGGLLSQYGWL